MADDIRPSSDRSSIGPPGRRNLLVLSLAALAMVGISAQAQTDRKAFSPEELDQILAPIALYDDALLSQILMAASYPLEIVEAARWSQANPNLKGDAAVSCRCRQDLGCQRQIPGGLSIGSRATQRASRLDPEAG